ncbi:transcription factor A, mitochondrial [Sparus aurata]|uniref:Transcription factor A, mitochondrial n=1 Tax=Sparus aurata TaxID=8175 RepID=A0A671V6N4_SPAAU|nr:transcription factor A, mitochondrial [Sparus aurata]
MAPFSLMAASVSCLAKSFTIFSCTSALARCSTVLPGTYFNLVRCLTSPASVPPKRPPNAYIRYVVQQKPVVTRQNPDVKIIEIIRKIAQQWRSLSPQQKQPFEEAYQRDREQFQLDLKHYQAKLTPAEIQQQALEKRQRLAKRKATRKKRELSSLGKPKRPRSPFNIFMSEHFVEARGTTVTDKMKSLLDDWKNLFSHQRQVYTQLAEDDKIRYKNEMQSWEEHMVEIGRSDLIREQSTKKASAKTAETTVNVKKKAKAKAVKAKGKSKATGKMMKSSPKAKAVSVTATKRK